MKSCAKRLKKRVAAGSLMSAIVLGSGLAFAQEEGASLAAQEATIHGGTLVMVTYFVLFGLVGLYFGWMMRRQAKIQRELEALEERMDGLLQ